MRPSAPSTVRRRALVPVIGVCVGVLAGCTTGTDDYRNQTETYLNDDSEPQFELTEGADISDAECDEPADLEIGTRYTCTATVEGLGSVVFTAEIDGENSFRVTYEPTDG